MSRNQKIFLFILGLYVIFDFVLGSLVGVFLWDKTKETSVILKYFITLFTSIMVFSQFSSLAIAKFGAKRIYIFSILLGFLQALFMLVFQNSIAQMIVIFGILSGASIGFQAVAYSIVASSISSGPEVTKFLGIKSSIMNIVSIIAVPFITYLISKVGSYNISYAIALCVGIVEVFLISRLDIVETVSNYHPFSYLSTAISNTDTRVYLMTRFVYGIFNGPIWAILGIVTFMFAGNLSIWGIISSIMTILNIIGSYIYGKLNSSNLRKAYSIFSTLIFASTTLILATNWNFSSFLLYQLGLVILNTTFAIHYESLTYDLISESEEMQNNKKEILGLGEICIGLGRILPLIILSFVGFRMDDSLIIQVLFVAIASMPVIIISLLKNTTSFQTRYAKIG